MNKKILLLLSLLMTLTSYSQKKYNKGFYFSISDLEKNSANINPEIEIEKRTNSKIKMVGGNDYQFNPLNDDVKKSFIRNISKAFYTAAK